MSDADDRFEIIAVLDRYAECLDTRDWPGLEHRENKLGFRVRR